MLSLWSYSSIAIVVRRIQNDVYSHPRTLDRRSSFCLDSFRIFRRVSICRMAIYIMHTLLGCPTVCYRIDTTHCSIINYCPRPGAVENPCISCNIQCQWVPRWSFFIPFLLLSHHHHPFSPPDVLVCSRRLQHIAWYSCSALWISLKLANKASWHSIWQIKVSTSHTVFICPTKCQ